MEQVLAGADVAFHLISSTVPGDEHVEVSRELSDNIFATLRFLEACDRLAVPRVVFASSSSVYGESETLPKVETMNTSPISPYAVSKLSAENYCRVFASVYGLRTVCLRYFNVYGPRQKPGPYSGVIPTFVNSVLHGEAPVIFGDGEQTRDFTYVGDAVSANLLSLERDPSPGEVFNVAGGAQVSLNLLAASIERIMGKPLLGTKHAPPREGDIRHSLADITKAKAVLGYSPRFSLEEGLREVIGSSVTRAAGH